VLKLKLFVVLLPLTSVAEALAVLDAEPSVGAGLAGID